MASLFTITLPLSLPGVLAGLVLGFARSLGEFGATITFVSNIAGETQTIPLAMYSFIQTPGAEAQTARLCLFAVILSLISLLLSETLSKRMQKNWGKAMLHINVQQQLGRLTLRADLQLPTQGVTAIFGLSGSGKPH